MSDAEKKVESGAYGDIELQLIQFITSFELKDAPIELIHEAKRSLLNMIATALAGSKEEAVEIYLSQSAVYNGESTAYCIGREELRDPLHAAFINAMSANIFDFDDTHPTTVIHPTAPVVPALLALSCQSSFDGAALLRAFIVGAEIECRLGNAISPEHYGRGWHITSTCGVVGAAIASAAMLRLDGQQLLWALGNAAVQAGGLVEALGSMSKSISVGNAARNGLLSALLAQQGFSGPSSPLSGQHGFLPVYGQSPRYGELTDGLGERWELLSNTYKPYPVGVVLNPVIDACLELHGRKLFLVEDVQSVQLVANPLLRVRTDRPFVNSGRQSQVSAQHAVAVVLERGRAGLDDFSDEAVAEMSAKGMSTKVSFIDDATLNIEAVRLCVMTNDGAIHRAEVGSATGSSKNPLSDVQLEEKLRNLASHAGFSKPLEPIIETVWSLENLSDLSVLARLLSLADETEK